MSVQTARRLDTVQEYYFSKKLREVRELAASGKAIINMAIGSPDLDPPQLVIEEIQRAATAPGAHKYQSYQGIPELREAFAGFYQNKYKVSLNPKNEILPLIGSKEGIMHISMAYLNEGDQVLIPNPGYPTYASITNLVGATPVFYDLNAKNNWKPDFKALENQDLSRVKLMWVNYPNMPTGASASQELFQNLIDFVGRNEILLVHDNPYSFVLNKEPISILSVPDAKKVAMELNSLSKTFNMAGWRVGMLAGSADKIEAVLKVKSNMDSGMFYGLQKGAITALQSSDSWYTTMNDIYENRRKLIWKLADQLQCSYDKEAVGMFVWAKLPEGSADDVSFIDTILYKNSIFITPGSIFGSNGEGYIRFSLCISEEKIAEAVERMKSDKENL